MALFLETTSFELENILFIDLIIFDDQSIMD